jgi:WD40 repeat protein
MKKISIFWTLVLMFLLSYCVSNRFVNTENEKIIFPVATENDNQKTEDINIVGENDKQTNLITKTSEPANDNHHLIVQIRHGYDNFNDLILMDDNGNQLEWIAKASGPAVTSRDGNLLAVVGCYDKESGSYTDKQICIYDLSTLPDIRTFPESIGRRLTIKERIEIPLECEEKNVSSSYSEIISMSWSYDDSKLLLVCGGNEYTSKSDVCVVSNTNAYKCWDKQDAMDVKHADWSPNENTIVVSKGNGNNSKVYLVDSLGKNEIFLIEGWSPEWSSRGDRIAFIRYQNMNEQASSNQMGIAIINKDGSQMKWIFLSDFGLDLNEYLFLDMCGGFDHGGRCELDWSPDDMNLIFISSYLTMDPERLFKVNIISGEIVIITDPEILGYFYFDPEYISEQSINK